MAIAPELGQIPPTATIAFHNAYQTKYSMCLQLRVTIYWQNRHGFIEVRMEDENEELVHSINLVIEEEIALFPN